MSTIKELYGFYFSYWLFFMAPALAAGAWLATGRLAQLAAVLTAPRAAVLAALLLGAGVLQMALYPVMPNYIDYVEPMIAVLALNLGQGAPLYGDWANGGGVQGSLFGPLVFMVQAAFLKVSPTIAASKIAGVAAAGANLLLLGAVLRKVLGDWPRTLVLLALSLVLVAGFRHFWFWNRPDPLLILLSTMGLAAYAWLKPRTALIAIGVLAGLAANLKLYTPLYLVPAGFMCLLALPTWGARIGYGALAAAASILVFLPPYASPAIEFGPFLHNLLVAGKLGLSFDIFVGSMTYIGMLVLPAAVLLYGRNATPRSGQDGALLWVLAATATALALITAKPGSGTPHLMPLAPVSVFLLARLLAREPADAPAQGAPAVRWVMVLGAVFVAPIWAWSFKEVVGELSPRVEAQRAAEARALYRQYPDAEMAISAKDDRAQFYRVYKAFDGRVVHFEGTNWLDLRWVDQPVDLVRPIIEDCRTPHWLTPKSAPPFTAMITTHALFDQKFRDDFAERYQIVRRGRFYDVWACSPPAA